MSLNRKFSVMVKLVLVLFLISSASFSQTLIGKTEGASIFLEDIRYVVTFQSNEEKYVSFYMPQTKDVDKDGLLALKKYVYLLFDNKKGDYLLQFEDDSILSIYENGNVSMEIWRKHNSDYKIRSKGFSLLQFQELFDDLKYVQKKL